jgi:hypothetical protein
MRKILGPKKGDVTGDWRELHRQEVHHTSSSLNLNPSDHIKKNETEEEL